MWRRGLTNPAPDAKPYVLHGRYLNLFDPELAVLNDVPIAPRTRMLLLDLNSVKPSEFKVVAAACRVRDEKTDGKTLQFRVDGIGDTNAVVQVAAHSAPVEVLVDGKLLDPSKYDYSAGLLRVRFLNSVEPVPVEVRVAR